MPRPTIQSLIGTLLILASAAMADERIDLEKGREFWAFRRPVKVEPPAVERRDWSRSEIDRFVLAKLEAEGQVPPRDLDKLKLVRRVYFDLHGLPPTPAQIDTFLGDASPGALGRLVDELLASPQFGERWGRHWLDGVSYSSGSNRSTKTPVTIRHGRGETTVRINQKEVPEIGGLFTSVGIYEFPEGRQGSVMISNDGTDGVTIVDAVQWVPVGTEASRQKDAARVPGSDRDRIPPDFCDGAERAARVGRVADGG